VLNEKKSNLHKSTIFIKIQILFILPYGISRARRSNIEFSNAISSSSLDANGNFELHFLEEGDYQINYCSYEENSTIEIE